jgi:hypothetical protein
VADPHRTTKIPNPLRIEMGVWNIMEENIIMSTCFTFDAMHKVSGDVSLFVISDEILREKAINPVDNRANIGARFTAGFNSLSQRPMIALTSPVRQDKIMHCAAAEGVILFSKSTGCNLNSPVSISPEATTWTQRSMVNGHMASTTLLVYIMHSYKKNNVDVTQFRFYLECCKDNGHGCKDKANG